MVWSYYAIFNALKSMIPNKANLIIYQVNGITKGTDAKAEVTVRLEEKSIIVKVKEKTWILLRRQSIINAMNKLIMKRKKAQDSKSLLQISDTKLNKHVI